MEPDDEGCVIKRGACCCDVNDGDDDAGDGDSAAGCDCGRASAKRIVKDD